MTMDSATPRLHTSPLSTRPTLLTRPTVPALLSCALAATLCLSTVPAAAAPGAPGTPDSPDAPGTQEAAGFPRHERPVPGEVLRAADIPEDNWLPGHRGVDLAARPGDPVHASADGVVHFAGVVAGTPLVSVDHGDGLRTTYEPVEASVSTGDRVHGGGELGVLADTATLPDTARRGDGLSWGARVSTGDDGGPDRYIDPMTLLGPVTVRLWE